MNRSPLNRHEFAIALKKGQGRALLHAMQHGIEGLDDLILDACIHNQSYDAQIESSRASWLLQMLKDSIYYQRISKSILNKLKVETDTWDLLQLCNLAREMAANGNLEANRILKERVFEIASIPSSDDSIVAELWVEVEDIPGFLDLARVYGKRLLIDPNDFVPDGFSQKEYRDALLQSAKNEREIEAYLNYLEARGVFDPRPTKEDREAARKIRHEEFRREYSLERILRDAKGKKGEFPGRYLAFGRSATAEELKTVYDHLLTEIDPAVRLRLLWVFRRAPLPKLDKRILEWAEGEDKELRAASINALAQISDAQIHELALSKLRAGKVLGADSDLIELFTNNFEETDCDEIDRALALSKPDWEDAHSLGFSILILSEKQQNTKLANALQWVYENTPCSNCRFKAIRQLEAWHVLSEEVLYECRFDAEEDIRNFAIRIHMEK